MSADISQLLADGVRAERAGALERALEHYRAAADAAVGAPALRARALAHQADVFRSHCEWTGAAELAREAQAIARTLGDKSLLADAIIAEANVHMCRGDFAAAMPMFSEVSATAPEPRQCGIAQQNIGSMLAQQQRLADAESAFRRSLSCFETARYRRGQGIALNNLGRLTLDKGDCDAARQLLERALKVAREVEDSDLAALASLNLAWTLCTAGEFDKSQDLAMAALGYFADCDNRWREIECLRLIGQINERCEDTANAHRCYELALSMAEQIGCEPEITATRARLAALSGK
jgi:tetratricopeptide (TPR) repeat protein